MLACIRETLLEGRREDLAAEVQAGTQTSVLKAATKTTKALPNHAEAELGDTGGLGDLVDHREALATAHLAALGLGDLSATVIGLFSHHCRRQ